MTPLRVLILHQPVNVNSPPDERDVLDEVRAVRKALLALGHRPVVRAMPTCLQRARRMILRARPDCVFNLVESLLGRGALAVAATALLDSLGLAYTGVGTAATALTTDKLATKRALQQAGLPTPAWVTATHQTGFTPGTFIFKPVAEDASVGVDDESLCRIRSLRHCRQALELRSKRMGRDLFAERFVDGREFNVSMLGRIGAPRVLPIGEIVFRDFDRHEKPKLVGYRAKWEANSFEYTNTVRDFSWALRARALHRKIEEIARSAFVLLNCHGYARLDLRLDRRGRLHILELNTNPCITPDSGFVAAAEQIGMDYPSLVAEILSIANPRD